MRNLVGILGAALILLGLAMLVVTGGMLDTPHSPIGPALLMGIATMAVFYAGGLLAQIYERGREH